jgi:hypothetical protein
VHTPEEDAMTGLLVLFLFFTALPLAAVRWGADTRQSGEWRWTGPAGTGRAGTENSGYGGSGRGGPRRGGSARGSSGPRRPGPRGGRTREAAPEPPAVVVPVARPGVPAPRPAPDPAACPGAAAQAGGR